MNKLLKLIILALIALGANAKHVSLAPNDFTEHYDNDYSVGDYPDIHEQDKKLRTSTNYYINSYELRHGFNPNKSSKKNIHATQVDQLIKDRVCTGCHLEDVDLKGKKLNHVDISHSSLKRSNLKNGSLERSKAVETDFEKANLKNLDARNSDFEKANFEGANAINANFSRGNLYQADMEGVNGEGANFQKATLTRADMTKGNWRGANFKEALILDTEFEGSDRTGATWTSGEKCLNKDCTQTSGGEHYEEVNSLST